jgi:hypothetical protein
MNKTISLAILTVSIIIFAVGFNMSNSVNTTVYPYFSGGLSIGTLLMLGIGCAGVVVAIIGLIRRTKQL